jgi:pimeloyl-ACP methyl ester carboxylesterase
MRGLVALLGRCIAVGCIASATAAGQLPAAVDRFVGSWQGTLGTPGAQLNLGLAVARDQNGGLQASLTTVDQAGLTIPATATMHGDTLVVDIPMIHGSYAAIASGDSLRGSFAQSGRSLPFTMGRVGALATVRHSQEPRPPLPYRTQDVTFESRPGVQLAGTLSVPQGAGPFPAVVLVPGSGPEDRDESSLGHRPFLVLADYLARHGIASLRFDDRGVGKSTGAFAGATSADLANDAEAALHYLARNPAVVPGHVGIVGHSEGGMIGAMIAARSNDVAFLILLAAPGLPGDSVAMLQKHAVFANNGLDPVDMARAMRFTRQVYDLAKSNEDSASATAKIQSIVRDYIASLPPDEQANAANDRLAESASAVTGAWFRYLLRYDPRTALRRVHVPVLAIDGTLDNQVTARENLAAIDDALKVAGNPDYRVLVVPKLNHSLQTAVTGSPTEAAALDETISPSLLDLVTSWITQRFGRK